MAHPKATMRREQWQAPAEPTMFLEDDLATPATKINSRHRVDRRSLLPLAARRDAVAACATRFDLRID
jgi:hypothetical protein